MSLKYYNALRGIQTKNPKESYYNDYMAANDLTFDNSPNVVYGEIEYEKTYGENDFEVIDRVRTDIILEYNTGIFLGDDHKRFIFPSEFKVEPYYGMKFRWKGSYWLVINTNVLDSMAVSAEVRRCNNVLRFYDKQGNRIVEPCIMDYTLRFANNKITADITFGNGEQKVWCQRNKRTELIKPNDRFLFGTPEQRVCFRVYSGGTKNYMNNVTEDDNSPTLTEFYINHYEVNPLFDDFKDGFANAYFNEINIKIDNSIDKMNIGSVSELRATVYKGNDIIDADLIWFSSNNKVADIDGGNVIAKDIGKATISVCLDANEQITSSFDLEVVQSSIEDIYEIVIDPETLYVLQGESQQYFVSLCKNGVKQSDYITIRDITKDVPKSNYDITGGTNNSFTVSNKSMFMNYPLLIECSCDKATKIFEISLRGLY